MKKWLLRISLGIFIFIGLLYVFVFVRSILPATVLDQGLKLERPHLEAGANAYDELRTAASQLWWPEAQSQQLADLARDTNWDAGLAQEVLEKNHGALAAWDAAAQLPDLQAPEIYKFDDLMPYLSDWKRLSQLAEVRENDLLRKGEGPAAFSQMMAHVQLGRRMQASRSVLIGYLVGTAVNSMALSQIQHWVGKTQLSPRQLQDYIRQLALDPADAGAAFANSMRAEYQCSMGTVEGMRAGKMMDPDTGKPYPHPTALVPVLNLSQTRALFANEFNALVRAATHPFSEANLPAAYSHRPSLPALVLSGNMLGQVWFYMMMPATSSALAKKCQSDVQLQATRTILALRAYQLTHGQLPADLKALVPEFLDEVPMDDFDGQPLRYSAERKMVYSVGKNLKDDGGDDRSPENSYDQRHLDLVYKFDF